MIAIFYCIYNQIRSSSLFVYLIHSRRCAARLEELRIKGEALAAPTNYAAE